MTARTTKTADLLRRMTVAVLGTTLVTLSLTTWSALAATPSNDTISGAKQVTYGFSETVDTTEATTDADDAAVNARCGFSSTDASVWYMFTATSDMAAVVDATATYADGASGWYYPGVIIATGSPGSLAVVRCAGAYARFTPSAGTTYYIVVIDPQWDGGGNGGTLKFSLVEPPSASVTVTDGTFDPATGNAALAGTYVCERATRISIGTFLTQALGPRVTVTGTDVFYTNSARCDGTPQPFSVNVEAGGYYGGERFAGGPATVGVRVVACGTFECADRYQPETEIRLRGGTS